MKADETALGTDDSHELHGLTHGYHRPVLVVVWLEAKSRRMHAEVLRTAREALRVRSIPKAPLILTELVLTFVDFEVLQRPSAEVKLRSVSAVTLYHPPRLPDT